MIRVLVDRGGVIATEVPAGHEDEGVPLWRALQPEIRAFAKAVSRRLEDEAQPAPTDEAPEAESDR